MPVYTVHAPATSGADLRSTDRFVFVRDGFHFWAMIFGPIWLAWHRLWLALIGYLIVIVALDLVLSSLDVGSTEIFFANFLLALLTGFEAASLQRWTLSRRHWRQLDVVVDEDAEAAERRFFDRWSARHRTLGLDEWAVDRGSPPPTRDIAGQPFSKPSSNSPAAQDDGIIGLFPEPGGSR
jgi:Protein of unknown function (DUF2628)